MTISHVDVLQIKILMKQKFFDLLSARLFLMKNQIYRHDLKQGVRLNNSKAKFHYKFELQ